MDIEKYTFLNLHREYFLYYIHGFNNFAMVTYRVVAPGNNSEINGYRFQNFGAHSNVYPTAYLTAAAAIGMTKTDVDVFITRLEKVLKKFKVTTATSGTDDIFPSDKTASEPKTVIGEENGSSLHSNDVADSGDV